MKEDIINVIRILGVGLTELILEIDLGFFVINSVEYREPDEIILHSFKDDVDYEMNFDELGESYQKYVHKLLTILVYN